MRWSVTVSALRSVKTAIQNEKTKGSFHELTDADVVKVIKKEISLIYLNFSDPWPKNRNAKRRLTHERLLSKYDSIFKKDKVIFMKTDNIKLFAFSIESLSNYGYKLKNVTLDLHSEDIENVQTEYEKKFSSKGIRINRLEAYK